MDSRNILEMLSRWEISTGSHLIFLQINLKKGAEISRNNPKVIPRTGLGEGQDYTRGTEQPEAKWKAFNVNPYLSPTLHYCLSL